MMYSCSATKYLAEEEQLYIGSKIRLEGSNKEDEAVLKAAAERTFRPQANSSILGMRPKLWLYYFADKVKSDKIRTALKKWSEPPVLLSNTRPEATASVIDSRFFNLGIFNSETSHEIITKGKTATIHYTSKVHDPFIISEFSIEIEEPHVYEAIQSISNLSLVKTGEPYRLSSFQQERVRINDHLMNEGFYFFNPDFLVFHVDTIHESKQAIVRMRLRDEVPLNALIRWSIGQISVEQLAPPSSSSLQRDSILSGNILFVYPAEEIRVRPNVLINSIHIEENQFFNRELHRNTIQSLMSLGAYRFARIQYQEDESTGVLNAHIRLTPHPVNALQAEIELVTKSNDYTGPRFNLNLLNRNTFGGSEQLKFSLSGLWEAQFNRLNENLFIYSINPKAELSFPRILSPFPIRTSTGAHLPKTNISLAYNYMSRVNFFDLQSFQLNYGYQWRNTKFRHDFQPVNISNTNLTNQSDEFKSLLDSNPFLRRSFEDQFIAGASYSITFNPPMSSARSAHFFLQSQVETAGNTLSILPEKLSGDRFARFVRLSADARLNLAVSGGSRFVTRLYGGYGLAYGNSVALPYNRQFFSGGPNSLRAFPMNALGPGKTVPSGTRMALLQSGGDIKLEMNAEYRFDIVSLLKGALFIDAGNVWINDNHAAANALNAFQFNSFLNEMAIGSGFGLRFDVTFFVLRFDMAIPLRKPWEENHKGWVVRDINPFNSQWRKENLTLNIAIGYPF